MANKLLVPVIALCVLLFQSTEATAKITNSVKSIPLDLQTKAQSITAHPLTKQLAKERIASRLHDNGLIEIEVVNFTKLDHLPEYTPACKGCTAITVLFSVTCTRVDGCKDLSVMDFYVTYESAYPTLFYEDEAPNPALQGKEYAGIIYGAQKEFSDTSLASGETTMGELSFTVKPDASNFVFHYHWYGHDEEDIAVGVTEATK